MNFGSGNTAKIICWLIICCVRAADGQGYFPSARSAPLGSTNTYLQLQQLYRGSKSWRQAYRSNPVSSCSKASRGSLCAAAGTQAVDAYAQLMMATSPQVYSSNNPQQAGKVRLVAAAGDQKDCQTCTAFAVVAAAETAMAAVLRVPVQDCSISVQALYFCPPSGPTRSCDAGWNLPEVLSQLEQRGSSLPTADCLQYKPDYKSEMTRAQLCEGGCSYPNDYADEGGFTSAQITSAWAAQRHIRQYGAVVTRFDVYSDFLSFFKDFANSNSVYKPGPGATMQFGHAVVLVGYNNDEEYWIAKNSYGPDWGDGGLFKVAFGVCSVLTGSAEAYGIIWTPNQPVAATQLPVTSAAPQRPGCYWYKAGPLDYLSRVAWLASIPLDQFMLDNTAIVKDLDAPLTGLQLLLCKPQPGTFNESILQPQTTITSPGPQATLPKHTGDPTTVPKALLPPLSPPATSPRHVAPITAPFIPVAEAPAVAPIPVATSPPLAVPVLTPDEQLQSLLRIKASIDTTGALKEWSEQAGVDGGYCNWPGVACRGAVGALKTVYDITISSAVHLKGTIPHADTFKGLPGLESVDISNQPGIRGPLPPDLPGHLQQIRLINNSLTGTLPAQLLGVLRQLTVLQLSGNGFKGPLPETLKGLTHLQVLDVSNNVLTGTLPPTYGGGLRQLTALYVQNNQFSGPLPNNYYGMVSLQEFVASNNSLTGTLPPTWSKLRQLQKLSAWGNILTGALPAVYTDLDLLEFLDLSDNALAGWLPPAWSQCKSLKGLWLYSNKLNGPLPTELPPGLEQLDLAGNALSGSLPPAWGRLSKLRVMELFRNKLSGTLPDAYQGLVALQVFSINNNAGIVGSVPASWKSMTQLRQCYLWGNPGLGGCLPKSWQSQMQGFDVKLQILEKTAVEGFCS